MKSLLRILAILLTGTLQTGLGTHPAHGTINATIKHGGYKCPPQKYSCKNIPVFLSPDSIVKFSLLITLCTKRFQVSPVTTEQLDSVVLYERCAA